MSNLSESHRTAASGKGRTSSNTAQTYESSEKSRELASSASLKSSDKCVYNSRLSDSGVWSGSNIQSEEITSPESPISKSDGFSYSSEKALGDNKSFMRLDSGIDVSVSQHLSELSLKDVDTLNDLNDPPSKSKSSKTNINEQFTTFQKSSEQSPQKLTLLETCFQQNEDGDTELHLAIIHKFIETVYALVRMVPHPDYLNIKNDDRQTPLHLAVLTRQPRLVRLLVCGGAALDVLDRCGNTALSLAVQANELACVRAIIDPITIPETLVAQLKYSPYQFHSQRNIANIYNYEGQTCSHLATLNGNIEVLRYLLWYGADINAREWKGGQTCLHFAVERKDLPLCLFLLTETMIDVEETSYAGHTAYQACQGWDAAITSALRQHGVETYVESESEADSDDDMLDVSENSFSGFCVNGSGLVNVGA